MAQDRFLSLEAARKRLAVSGIPTYVPALREFNFKPGPIRSLYCLLEIDEFGNEATLLIGHQRWLPGGTGELTLADLWPDNRVVAAVVGLNPAPKSVDVGHYYQGPAGQRQLLRPAGAGLFDSESAPFLDDAALLEGIAFTDIVKLPTLGEKQVKAERIRTGLPLLEASLAARGVPLVIGVFRHPVLALLGLRKSKPGLQESTTRWGARVFRMPGPYQKTVEADRVLGELGDLLREIGTRPRAELHQVR